MDSSNTLGRLMLSDTKIPLSDSKLSDGMYLFMLGEKYLKAQIDSTKQKEVIYPPKYYETKTRLEKIQPILEKIAISKANGFSYVSSPDYPVVKDRPKKGLILVIGLAVGLILSTFVVLIIHFFRNE